MSEPDAKIPATPSSSPEETKSGAAVPEAIADSANSVSFTLAAIDLGSNSFHLVVARLTNGTLQPLVQEKQLVRLADGLGANRELSHEAMERGLAVLRIFGQTIAPLHPSNIRIVATYTLRRAKNRNVFLRAARKIFPFPVEVISGDEEARLIYQGVAHTTHAEGKRLVIDIGGGSTEFAIGHHFDILQLSSQPMGCINYTKRFFADGKITRRRFENAETRARQRLEIIDRRFCKTGWDVAIGTSGTIKAINQYAASQNLLENGEITLTTLQKMKTQLIKAKHADLVEGVDDSRKSVIAAGLAVLTAIFTQFNIAKMGVSEAALREGVLYELTERMQHQDIRERTVNSLMLRFNIDQEQSQRVLKTAMQLYRPYAKTLDTEKAKLLESVLTWATSLYEIGLHINRHAIQKHSEYILENIEMPGFSDDEQQLLGVLVGRSRKNFSRSRVPEFAEYDSHQVFILILILRLATLLHQRRLDDYIPEILFEIEGTTAKLSFPDNWLPKHPLIKADLKFETKVMAGKNFSLTVI